LPKKSKFLTFSCGLASLALQFFESQRLVSNSQSKLILLPEKKFVSCQFWSTARSTANFKADESWGETQCQDDAKNLLIVQPILSKISKFIDTFGPSNKKSR
jgi:hypothetical protein